MRRKIHVATAVGWRRLATVRGARTGRGSGRTGCPAGDVFDAVSLGGKQPFSRPEETSPWIRDARMGEDVVIVQQERPAQNEIDPVIASPQGGGNRGIRRPQPEADPVGGPDVGDCLLGPHVTVMTWQ